MMMELTVPLLPVGIAFLILIFVLPVITYAVIWLLVPFLNVQLFANLGHHDVIVEDDGSKVTMQEGKKKRKDSSLYIEKKGSLSFLGMGKTRYVGIDPTKWDKHNGSRFGSTTMRFRYPGKLWMKNIPRMFATQTNLLVAQCKVDEKATEQDIKAIIKHNKYLYMIARDNPEKALALMQADKKEEIEKLANEFLILPKGVDEKDEAAKKNIVKELVQEVEWVKEYCSTLPEDVNLSEMMKAYPDRETCYELMAKLDAESEIEAKANSNADPMKLFLIVGGIVLIAALMEIITIALLVK